MKIVSDDNDKKSNVEDFTETKIHKIHVLQVAIDSFDLEIVKAIIEKGIKNVIVAGGVAANQGLRKAMEELTNELNVQLSIPPMKYCTDNGTMIAAAGYYAMLDGRKADLTLNSKSQDTLQ